MIELKATITGDKEVIAKIKKLAEMNRKAIETVIKKTALLVEKDAKKKVLVKTGRLRASITHAITTYTGKYPGMARFKGSMVTFLPAPAAKSDEIAAIVGTSVKYAPYIEFGTVRSRAYPYLFPALKNNRDNILKLLNAEIKGIRP